MIRYFLLSVFLFVSSLAFCDYPQGAVNNIDGSVLGWDETNQVWRPIAVDSNGGINSGGTTIENISVDTSSIESYLKKTTQPSEFRTSRLSSISANTAISIVPINNSNSLASNRIFVELRAIDPDSEFYIGFDNTVSDSTGRPVKGRILLSMPNTQALYIYHTNSSAIDVQQTEGWN
jgi:hypothetical protein